MKKTYQKPELFAESFALAEHISAGCADTGSYSVNNSSAWTCVLTSGSTTMFMLDGKCSDASQPIDPDLYESAAEMDEYIGDLLGGLCYTTYSNGPMISS